MRGSVLVLAEPEPRRVPAGGHPGAAREAPSLRVERKVFQGAHSPRDLGSPRAEPSLPKSLEPGKGATGRREDEGREEGRGERKEGRDRREEEGTSKDVRRGRKMPLIRDKVVMWSQEVPLRGPGLVGSPHLAQVL